MSKKECIILAGGLGTRLRSVVEDLPKCMATVAKRPFISYIFDHLERSEFNHVVLALGYKSDIILEWLETQNRSFKISYIIEQEPLGTGGAIKSAFLKIEGDSALVLNGDTYFDIDIDSLISFHAKKKADISLALKAMKDFDRYGSVHLDTDCRINKFEEKRYLREGLINGGVYFINRNVMSNSFTNSKFSFEKEILENQVGTLKIYGLPFDNYFIDIGIPTDYEKANLDFINK